MKRPTIAELKQQAQREVGYVQGRAREVRAKREKRLEELKLEHGYLVRNPG